MNTVPDPSASQVLDRPAPAVRCRSWALCLLGAIALLIGVTWFAWNALETRAGFVHDDAFITARYARNWAHGYGPVWNAGERVEGYTSFVAVCLGALQIRLGTDPLDALYRANVLGILLFGFSAGLLAWKTMNGPRRVVGAAFGAGLAFSSASLLTWVSGRLETPIFVGAISLAWTLWALFELDPSNRCKAVCAGALMGIIPSIRPDGAWFVGVAMLPVTWRLLRSPEYRRASMWMGIAVLVPVTAHLIFRLSYYGDWLPNSVRAKAFGLPEANLWPSGIRYVRTFLRSPPHLPWLAVLAWPLACTDRRLRLPATSLLVAIVGYALLIARVGGDHMPAHRLLLPLLAPSTLLVVLGLAASRNLNRSWAQAAIWTVAIGWCAVFVPGQLDEPPEPIDRAALGGSIVGRFLADNYPPGTTVALNTAGSTPYYAPDLRFIDMLGLNDRHIASRKLASYRTSGQRIPGHAKGDGAYLLRKAPDLIIIGPAAGLPAENGWFLSEVELSELAEFSERYKLRVREVPVSPRAGLRRLQAYRNGMFRIQIYERMP